MLSDLAVVKSAPADDFAERLSTWVGVFDATVLHAAHQSVPTEAAYEPSDMAQAECSNIEERIRQVRAILERAIVASGASAGMTTRIGDQFSQSEKMLETMADFVPFRQHYLNQQRSMELMIGPLRGNVREIISKASPALRQLAALDAVWEQLLAAREQKLLLTVPALLERRYSYLLHTHQHDDSPFIGKGGGWLDAFASELHAILLAELDTRLQPIMGLFEAFSYEIKKY